MDFSCDILYQDDHLVAIHKPYGYFVHKTSLDATSDKIIMKLLRDQLGRFVYPIHRLDRKTAGVLLFALDKETHAIMSKKFEDRHTDKKYIAICRGHMDVSGEIDYDLTTDEGKVQDAVTTYRTLQLAQVPIPHGKFTTSRYSLVEFTPITGRMHQIRKHASHIFHPIVADRPHGCNKQNKFFLENFQLNEMMLHAWKLSIEHPYDEGVVLNLHSAPSSEFVRIGDALGFDLGFML
jgi:tRNA pseudouridine65 synthase